MSVWRNVIVGRELKSLHNDLAVLLWVTDQDGDLATFRNVRVVLPGQRIGSHQDIVHGSLPPGRTSSPNQGKDHRYGENCNQRNNRNDAAKPGLRYRHVGLPLLETARFAAQ